MSIIAKPFVNMLIANAEEHYLWEQSQVSLKSPHIYAVLVLLDLLLFQDIHRFFF